ncbi:unnamed protein product [Rangifer tarandus platyrhynchus]|uniref:Uncharacterized protein n=1 Tax=Rangifer tarandus platyrhynchus TaxID=3082113 RepID=A0ABN8XYE0_RANTA|nr:unnamed protein product [Rangifer tarandus platyrhynchus]
MRGRGGGRAPWPAPVRSLLRAFRARDAAATARGPAQDIRCAPSTEVAPPGSGCPRSQGGRLRSQTTRAGSGLSGPECCWGRPSRDENASMLAA